MGQTRQKAVAKAIEAIQQFHVVGFKIPSWKSPKGAYNAGTLLAAAAKYRMNPDTARKARQFVAPDVGYTAAELKALCRTIRAVQGQQEDGLPVFGRTHIIRLLTIKKNQRAAFQTEAIEGAWSIAELEAQIATQLGTRRDGGRRRRGPKTEGELLVQIDGLCERWRRWQLVVDPTDDRTEKAADKAPPAAAAAPTVDQLPEALRNRVRAVGRAIDRLQTEVAAALAAGDTKRVLRTRFRPKAGADGARGQGA